uniref:ribosomal protein S6 n=1 Tax=Timspurckia oligopyrenoides TaxID=708627 RepID=UPI001FCD85D3|nr:ribosomal protein S6 [Timspurckia oligopyrenoides]UNJ17426.1 ribosomal protein S6 [Timspurckia oligopyrenoides]
MTATDITQTTKMNNYETIYILRPDISEEIILSVINKYQNILISQGGKNIFIQNRGRRHLTYSIKRYHDGIYIQMNYEGNGELVKMLQKEMNFDDNIIRILTIKQDSINLSA